ncbi:hypothetical protein PGB90_003344 [Kerria lacca]
MEEKSLSDSNKKDKSVVIPATPDLKRLGYGTGVGVFRLDRSPFNGNFSSPWAVKKKLHAQSEWNTFFVDERLSKEADILKSLDHPNIIGFRAMVQTPGGQECLAMEKCDTSLADIIEERGDEGPFSADIILKVAIEIAKALDYIHNVAYLLHGDIKSSNILIKENFNIIKLCDFGVCLPLNADGSFNKVKAGDKASYIGTELWNAPEVCPGKNESIIITDKADIFSYGLTLWEMMSMTVPHMSDLNDTDSSFDEESFDEKLEQLIGTRPAIPENIQVDKTYVKVISLFMKCTEHDYIKRFSAKDILKFCVEN